MAEWRMENRSLLIEPASRHAVPGEGVLFETTAPVAACGLERHG